MHVRYLGQWFATWNVYQTNYLVTNFSFNRAGLTSFIFLTHGRPKVWKHLNITQNSTSTEWDLYRRGKGDHRQLEYGLATPLSYYVICQSNSSFCLSLDLNNSLNCCGSVLSNNWYANFNIWISTNYFHYHYALLSKIAIIYSLKLFILHLGRITASAGRVTRANHR